MSSSDGAAGGATGWESKGRKEGSCWGQQDILTVARVWEASAVCERSPIQRRWSCGREDGQRGCTVRGGAHHGARLGRLVRRLVRRLFVHGLKAQHGEEVDEHGALDAAVHGT